MNVPSYVTGIFHSSHLSMMHLSHFQQGQIKSETVGVQPSDVKVSARMESRRKQVFPAKGLPQCIELLHPGMLCVSDVCGGGCVCVGGLEAPYPNASKKCV